MKTLEVETIYKQCGHSIIKEKEYEDNEQVQEKVEINDYCDECFSKIKKNVMDDLLEQIKQDFEGKYGKFKEIKAKSEKQKKFAEDMRKRSLILFLKEELVFLFREIPFKKGDFEFENKEQEDLYKFLCEICNKYLGEDSYLSFPFPHEYKELGFFKAGFLQGWYSQEWDRVTYTYSLNLEGVDLSSEADEVLSLDPKEFLKILENTDPNFWINAFYENKKHYLQFKLNCFSNEDDLKKFFEEKNLKEKIIQLK